MWVETNNNRDALLGPNWLTVQAGTRYVWGEASHAISGLCAGRVTRTICGNKQRQGCCAEQMGTNCET